MSCCPRGRAFTLTEVLLVLLLLGLLAGLAVPVMFGELQRRRLTESAEQLRSLITMARAQAMVSGQRYRIRWQDESDQPMVEREPDPIDAPGQFKPVEAAWARGDVLSGSVQCYEVRLGRPEWLGAIQADSEQSANTMGVPQREEIRPAVVFEPTGRSQWATFVIGPAGLEELQEDSEQLWVILDGRTGQVEVRSPPTEEELEAAELEREKLLAPLEAGRRSITVEQPSQREPSESDFVSGTVGTAEPGDFFSNQDEDVGGGRVGR